jgi:hypothetical protein
MRTRLLTIVASAGLLFVGSLALGCAGNDDTADTTPSPASPATETPPPSPAPTLDSPEPTVRPASTPVRLTPRPAVPTSTPEPVAPMPTPAATATDCPVNGAVCSLAEKLATALQAGNYNAIVDLMQSREHVCPGGSPQGSGGPFPLCDGASTGEVRSGYQLSRRYSEGYIVGRDGVIAFLEGFVTATSDDIADQYGTGALRLQAVSCVQEGGSCTYGSAIFTAILDGTHRELLAFSMPVPADPATPVDLARNGILLLDEEPVLFETGGQMSGFGEVFVIAN